MGDMADMALEEVLDFESDMLDYRLGFMSEYEAYERGVIDERGGMYSPRPIKPFKSFRPVNHGVRTATVKCKYCGKPDLRWVETPSGWRLTDEAIIHRCDNYDKQLGKKVK